MKKNILNMFKHLSCVTNQHLAPIGCTERKTFNCQLSIVNCFFVFVMAANLTANAQLPSAQPYLGKSPREVRQVMRREGFTMPMMKLDDRQREGIRKIRTEQMKARSQTRHQLKEKRAKLELLQTADKPDMKEIDKLIDEIAALQAQDMKARAADRQKIRSLLTEEQRIHFDAQKRSKRVNR
jgi:Spy/CpxP family protein refolding chaperone